MNISNYFVRMASYEITFCIETSFTAFSDLKYFEIEEYLKICSTKNEKNYVMLYLEYNITITH